MRMPRTARRGSALIIVLWSLLLMTMAIFSVVEMIELSVDHASFDQNALEARGLAYSGLALGLHPQLLKDDPILAQKFPTGRQFKTIIGGEAARMNLNFVLLTNHREILVNLFSHWGLQVDEATHVANCMYDWVTPGDLKSLGGAKAADYQRMKLPQRPTYKAFESFDEVEEVMDIGVLEKAHPNWKDSFTLWSTGPLNVNEAPADLIASIFSLDPGAVALFVKARNGRDEIPGTADDVPVKDITALQGQLGVSTVKAKALGNQVAFSDSTRRVDAVGTVGSTQVTISVVTRLNSSPIQYFLWSER